MWFKGIVFPKKGEGEGGRGGERKTAGEGDGGGEGELRDKKDLETYPFLRLFFGKVHLQP